MRDPKRREYEKRWREVNREKYLAKRRKYYLQNQEKIKTEMREYYAKVRRPLRMADRPKYKEIDRLWAQKRREKFRALFLEIKREMGNKCSRCDFDKHPSILQFHHHNGGKVSNVSELKSFKKIRLEAAKCILLCPNCHMEITFVKSLS